MATIEGINGIAKVEQHSAEIAQLKDVIEDYEKAIQEMNEKLKDCDETNINLITNLKCTCADEIKIACSCKHSTISNIEFEKNSKKPIPANCPLLNYYKPKNYYCNNLIYLVINRNFTFKNYENAVRNISMLYFQNQLPKPEGADVSVPNTIHELNVRAAVSQCQSLYNQYKLLDLQINEFKQTISKQRALVNDYEKKLAKKQQELKTLYRSTPEVFITDNHAVYCFALSEYEPYPNNATGYRLIGIIDNYDNQLSFNYTAPKCYLSPVITVIFCHANTTVTVTCLPYPTCTVTILPSQRFQHTITKYPPLIQKIFCLWSFPITPHLHLTTLEN